MNRKTDLDLKEGIGIKTAVDIVVFNNKGQVLLGERLALAGKNCWGFPGGHQKTGEQIRETAKREIREELGDKVKIEITDEIIAIRENNIPPDFIPHITIIVKGIYKGGKIQLNEPKRCLSWRWFDLNKLPSPMFSGEEEVLLNYQKKRVKIVSDWWKKN